MTMSMVRGAVGCGRVRGSVELVLWAYTPFRTLNAMGIDDLVVTNVFTDRHCYLHVQSVWNGANRRCLPVFA